MIVRIVTIFTAFPIGHFGMGPRGELVVRTRAAPPCLWGTREAVLTWGWGCAWGSAAHLGPSRHQPPGLLECFGSVLASE